MEHINARIRALAILPLAAWLLVLGGCNSADLHIDAPILEAAGINLTSKKADDESVPERPGIVLPPSTQSLPEPGVRTASAQQTWPEDADKIRARKEKEAAEAEEKYCAEGNWSDKANIVEFEKNVGRKPRCQSKLGKAISKQIGGGQQDD